MTTVERSSNQYLKLVLSKKILIKFNNIMQKEHLSKTAIPKLTNSLFQHNSSGKPENAETNIIDAIKINKTGRDNETLVQSARSESLFVNEPE